MDQMKWGVVALIASAIPLLAADYCFRRWIKLSWIVFAIFPLLFFPLWIEEVQGSRPFSWVKIVLLFPVIFVLLIIRTFPRLNQKWAFLFFKYMLAVNIFSAVIVWVNVPVISIFINGATGLLLILTIPPVTAFSLSKEVYYELEWDASYSWIGLYTIWNGLFAYFFIHKDEFYIYLPALLIPLAVSLWNRKRWLQSRAVTLFAYFVLTLSFSSYTKKIGAPIAWSEEVYLLLNILTFTYGLGYAVHYYWKRYRKRAS